MGSLRWALLLMTAGCTINSGLVFATNIGVVPSSCRSVGWNGSNAESSTVAPDVATGGIKTRMQLLRRSKQAYRTRNYCPTPPNYCIDAAVSHCGSNQRSASPS